MRPAIIRTGGLDLRRNPIPRNIPAINAEGGREIRAARMGEQGIFQGTREEREILRAIRQNHVGRIGPGKTKVWTEELIEFHK